LGTGLVTSEGALWSKQRTLISYALRVEILDDIVGVALRAVERLVRVRAFVTTSPALSERRSRTAQCVKLEKVRGTKQSIEVSEEFRHLTLQVIGESILSMTPEESDSVFPYLYLPIMVRFAFLRCPVHNSHVAVRAGGEQPAHAGALAHLPADAVLVSAAAPRA